MNRWGSAVGRADLLRALAVVRADLQVRRTLAAALGFMEKPKAGGERIEVLRLGPPQGLVADVRNAQAVSHEPALQSSSKASMAPPKTNARPRAKAVGLLQAPLIASTSRPPLKAALFGIVSAELIKRETKEEQRPPPPLAVADYLPRKPGPLHFQPLQSRPALARHLQLALALHQPSRMLDVRRAVGQLALGRQLTRWPRLYRPQEPDHVTVVVDRSLRLRPYWDDQDQLVAALYQWLGTQGLSTVTVQGDPWQPLACWLRGHEHHPVPAFRPPPANSVVLLLTDMSGLQGSVPNTTDAASAAGRDWTVSQVAWVRLMRYLECRGARVLIFPPIGMMAFTGPSRPSELGSCRTDVKARPVAVDGDQPPVLLESLLTLLSCARRIEPELVRAVRRLVPVLAAHPGLEAQLWAHRTCMDAGHDVCVWQPGAAWAYRRRFEAVDPGLQQTVLRVLLQVHGVRGRAIEVQEILAWASHVSPHTAAPFSAEIAEARQWLARLPLELISDIDAVSISTIDSIPRSDLLALVQQIQAAQGGDEALAIHDEDLWGPLWGLAHVATLQQGKLPPSPGALPAAKLAQWVPHSDPAGGHANSWCLRQVEDLLVLSQRATLEDGARATSRLGQPLTSRTLAWVVHPGGESQFTQRDSPAYTLACLRPSQQLSLTTDALQLLIEEIDPPFAYSERGRDRYGLYADFPLKGRDGRVIVQRMRFIEPGRFLMGSPSNEKGRLSNEGPQHLVTLTQGLWLADTACTQELWLAVMGENPSCFNEKSHGGAQYPVERVSWRMVQEFLIRLQPQLAWQASLPTEAEWEYACRAGSIMPVGFGRSMKSGLANYGNDRGSTVPVKSRIANIWGLYQMQGNVWEWCADGLKDYGEAEQTDPGLVEAQVPHAQTKTEQSAIRGGSWIGDVRSARPAQRSSALRDDFDIDLGFRFALRPRSQIVEPEVQHNEVVDSLARRSPVLSSKTPSRDAAVPGSGVGSALRSLRLASWKK